MRNLLTTTALSGLWARATFNAEPVVIVPGGGDSAPEGIIEQVVEARVEAALATEEAAEAVEVAEAADQRSESNEQWLEATNRRLSEWEDRLSTCPTREEMAAMMDDLRSSISPLILQLLSERFPEPSSPLTMEAETLTEAAAEAIAENPDLSAVAVTATNTNETLTEASSETLTEAPSESGGESVTVVAVAEPVADRPRMRARLV